MKRLFSVVVLSFLFSGSIFAATITKNASDYLINCSDPSSGGCNFQVDINGNMTGASVVSNGALSGTTITATGLFTPQTATSAAIGAITPSAAGQLVFCSNCGSFNGGTRGGLCISTGTGAGAFMAISSATAVSSCN